MPCPVLLVARAFLPAVPAFVPAYSDHQAQESRGRFPSACNAPIHVLENGNCPPSGTLRPLLPTPAGMRARQPKRPRHELKAASAMRPGLLILRRMSPSDKIGFDWVCSCPRAVQTKVLLGLFWRFFSSEILVFAGKCLDYNLLGGAPSAQNRSLPSACRSSPSYTRPTGQPFRINRRAFGMRRLGE
jgi:hypothetical protein